MVVVVGGATTTLLARYLSNWATPALYGLAGSALLSVTIVALKAIARLPRRRPVTDLENIESEVHRWLDNFRVTVKNDPITEAYFRFIVTLDSGTKVVVGRPRGELSGYILVRGEVILGPEDQKMIAALSQDEVADLLLELRLELARAKVGYSGLALPIDTIAIFKRIPISEALTEDAFFNKLEEVEAALNTVGIISVKGFRRNGAGASKPMATTELLPASTRDS